MALFKYLTFAKQAGTGVQDVTGVGFAGKALLLWTTRQTATGATDGATLSLGMTDGVDQGTRFIRHPDNEAATTSAQSERTDCVVYQTSATSGATPTVQNRGVFDAFTADGFQIDWTTNDGAADIYHAIVFGGDMQAKYLPSQVTVGANANQTFTGVGFQPESFVVIGGGYSSDYNNGAPYGSMHGFGFSNVGSNVCGWTVGFGTGSAAVAYRGQHTDRVVSVRVANLTGFRDTEICGLTITGVNSDGFTMRRHTSNGEQPVQHVLCLRGIQTALGSFNAPTSVGSHSLSLPFEPELLMLQSHNTTTATADDMSLAMGVWQNGDVGATWIGGTSGANPSVYARSTVSDRVLQMRTPNSTGSSSAVAIDATVSSVSGAGASLAFGTVSGVAVQVLYMAFASSDAFIDGDPGPLVTVDLTDRNGTHHVFAEVDLNDRDAYYSGYKAPKIAEAPTVSRGLSDAQGRIQHATFGVVLSDTDRELRALLDDDTAQYLVNAPLVVRTVGDDDRRLEEPMRVEMSGYVSDFSPRGRFKFALQGVDWLKRKSTRKKLKAQFWQPVLTRDVFPLLASDKLNTAAQIVYGKVSDENGATISSALYPHNSADPGWREFGYNGWGTGTLLTQTYYAYCTTITGGVESTRYAFQLGFAANPSSPAFHVRLLESRTPDYFRFYLSDSAAFEPFHNPLAGTFARYIDVDPTTIPTTTNPYGGPTGNRFFLIDSPTIGSDFHALVTAGGATAVRAPRGACPVQHIGEKVINDETWSGFLISRGAVSDVVDVFVNGVRVTDYGLAEHVLCPFKTDFATEFGADYEDIGGARYTILYAKGTVALHAIDGSAPITVNVWGLESTGDTTGTLLESPLDVHKHFVTNFYGASSVPLTTWATSAEDLPVTTPCVDEASYTAAATVLAARVTGGYVCAGVIGAGGAIEDGLDVLAALQLCGDFDAGIDRVGRIMVTAEPDSAPGSAIELDDVLHIVDGSFELSSTANRNFANHFLFNHTKDYTGRATSGWAYSGEVFDAASITNNDTQKDESLDLRFLRTETTGGADTIVDVVQRRRLRYRKPFRTVVLDVPYLASSVLELGAVLRLTHVEGTGASGWVGHDVRITDIEFLAARLTLKVTAYDLQPIYDGLDDAVTPTQWLNAESADVTTDLQHTVNEIGNGGIYQLTGDVAAGPGNGAQAATIANGAVTLAKLANSSAASRLLGRGAGSGAGVYQELTLGSNLSLSGTTLNATSASGGGAGATVYDDAIASPPSSPVSGDVWWPVDSYWMLRYDGSDWIPYGPIWKMVDPALQAPTTWVNQGGSTVSSATGGIHLSVVKSGSTATPALRIQKKTAPSTPYTVTAFFIVLAPVANFNSAGLLFRNSGSGSIETLELNFAAAGTSVVVNRYTSATAYSATPASLAYPLGTFGWIRITDDGTNRVHYLSADGRNWTQLYSVGRTTFLTADEIGFFGNAQQNTVDIGVTLVSYEET